MAAAFSDFKVEQGGVGAGAVHSFRLTAGGRTRAYRMRVDEPEPGRVFTETDELSSAGWTSTPAAPHERRPGRERSPRCSVVVGMPGFEPHQPVPPRPGVYVPVRLTCMFPTEVCCNVQVYAHRL